MCRGVAGENTEARLRAEELARSEARGRQEAEDLASVEARGRQEAELASQEIESQMAGLQGRNQELMAEVERLTHLLLKKPKVREGLLLTHQLEMEPTHTGLSC